MTAPHPDGHPLRTALAELAEVKGNGEDCFPSEVIWDSAAERLPAERNRAVIRHLAECSACAVAWELARDLAPARPQPSVSSPPRSSWLPLAAAAALVVGMAGLWLYAPWRFESAPATYRDPSSGWLVSEIAPDRVLSRDVCVLRWAAGPEGTTYDVRVTSDELEPVAEGWDLDRPEFVVDPVDLDGVPRGGKIFWRVTAHLPTGRDVVSATFIHVVE